MMWKRRILLQNYRIEPMFCVLWCHLPVHQAGVAQHLWIPARWAQRSGWSVYRQFAEKDKHRFQLFPVKIFGSARKRGLKANLSVRYQSQSATFGYIGRQTVYLFSKRWHKWMLRPLDAWGYTCGDQSQGICTALFPAWTQSNTPGFDF